MYLVNQYNDMYLVNQYNDMYLVNQKKMFCLILFCRRENIQFKCMFNARKTKLKLKLVILSKIWNCLLSKIGDIC